MLLEIVIGGGITVTLMSIMGHFLLKKTIPRAIFDGYTAVMNDINDEDTQKELQTLVSGVLKGGLKGGVQGVLPKMDFKSLAAILLMSILNKSGALGNIGDMLGSPQVNPALPGPQQQGNTY